MGTQTVLRGITWDHPRAVDGLLASSPLLHDGLAVDVEWEARSLLQFGDQLISDFAPAFDLMIIDHPHVADAVEAGAVLPLDRHLGHDTLLQLRAESVGQSHDSYRYRGQQWGLAIDAAAQVSAFRPDQIDGVPPYWPDVLELARRSPVLWPYKPVDAFSTFATLCAQLGAPLGDGEHDFIDRTAAGDALELMVELAGLVPDWCADANPIDVSEALATTADFSVAVALFGYTNYAREDFRPHRVVYDDIPSFDGRAGGSTLGGAGVAVSAFTPHPELSVAVAAALAGATAQCGPYTTGGGQPGNLRAWKRDSLNSMTGGFFRNTLRTLERAWVRPRVPGWPDLQLELSHLLHECLVDGNAVTTTIARIEDLPARHLKAAVL